MNDKPRQLGRTLRTLGRSRGYTAAAVLVTALGAGLALAVLATVRAGTTWTPAPEAPAFDRAVPGVPGAGWTEELRTVPEVAHAGVEEALGLVFGVAVLVLAGTCVTVAALVLSRMTARRHELSVRAALGAAPARVAAGTAAETLLVALAGAALGAAAGVAGLGILRAAWPGEAAPWLATAPDARSLLLAAGLPVLAAVLSSAVPAFAAARGDLHRHLTTGSRATAGRYDGWLRRVITVAQVAVSMALLTGALALVRSAAPPAARAANPGFDPRDTLTLRMEVPARLAADAEGRAAYLGAALAELRALPGVRGASLSTPGAWLGIGPEDRVTTRCRGCYEAGRSLEPTPVHAVAWGRNTGINLPSLVGTARHFSVSPGYFRALGLPLLGGRELGAGDGPDAPPAVVINAAMARRLFPNAEPVGQRLLPNGMFTTAYLVVGVVGDARPGGVADTVEPVPAVYFSALQHPPRAVAVAVRAAGNPLAMAPAVGRALRRSAPGARLGEMETMEAVLARHRAPAAWFAGVLGALAAFAAFLCAAGVYAVVAFHVSRRRREIGIRMAVGAREGQVVRHVVGQGARVTRMGVGIGALAALALGRGLEEGFRGVHPYDPATYLAVALLLAAAALLASLGPARRAARVDPTIALQAE